MLERLQSKALGLILGRLKLSLQELYKENFSCFIETYQKLCNYSELSRKVFSPLEAEILKIGTAYNKGPASDCNQKAKFKTTKLREISTAIRKFMLKIIENQPTQSSLSLPDFLPKYCLQNEYMELYFDAYLNKRNQAPRKVSGFLNRVEFVNNELNFGIRIFIKGNNGQIFPFVLQFCLLDKYIAQTSVCQMYELVNIILNKENRTLEQLQSQQSLLIAPNSKIVSECKNSKTLLQLCALADDKEEFTDFFCENKLLSMYHKFHNMDYLQRKKIYFPIELLQKAFLKHMDLKSYFKIKRKFAKVLAINNFMKYSFCLNLQNPDLIHIDLSTGDITIHDLSFQIFPDHTCDEVGLPFRLTPNISKFIGHEINRSFKDDMISAARCLHKHDQEILFFLKALWNNRIFLEYGNRIIRKGIRRNAKGRRKRKIYEEKENKLRMFKRKIYELKELIISEGRENGKRCTKRKCVEDKIEILDIAENCVLKKIKDMADLQEISKTTQLIESSQNDLLNATSLYTFCKYKIWL